MLDGDEPPVLLGSNHGPNAVEVVLHALVLPGRWYGVQRRRLDADAPEDRIAALWEHVQKTSPVLDILRNPVAVTITRA